MQKFIIDTFDSYVEFKTYLSEDKPEVISVTDTTITTKEYIVDVIPTFSKLIPYAKQFLATSGTYANDLIFGKNKTEGIVKIEVKDDLIIIFKVDGTIETLPMTYWMVSNKNYDGKHSPLKGDQHFKFMRKFTKRGEFLGFRKKSYNLDCYGMYSEPEMAMAYHGITEFKGLKLEDIKVLSFDIETDGLIKHSESLVYLITNTVSVNQTIVSKTHFRLDEHANSGEMIDLWCKYVREQNPDVITGHNIIGYDLAYLRHVAGLYNKELNLGRDGSAASFRNKPSNYRVDGTQTWEYYNCDIYGRHIIDTMFTSVKYDIGRKYPSWGLKDIIKYEKLVKEGRQFYDAGQIHRKWHIPEEREKIVQYGKDDSDDALALFYLQVPSFFYMTQSIPKPFQTLINGASGAWVNSIFVRDYLQNGFSIPKPSETNHFEGAISYGIPGIYSNCFKQDVASLYPSIMIVFDVCDGVKDYRRKFPEVVKYFTNERLKNKKIAKDTGDNYYKALEQSQKILINSMYGFLSTKGCHFNSPENASLVTRKGRDILNTAMTWATGYDFEYWKTVGNRSEISNEITGNYRLVNCDTDSIMVHKKDESPFTDSERLEFLKELNSQFPEGIHFEDDGYFDRVIVIKAKNYVLRDAEINPKTGIQDVTFKGSSLKSSSKEKALAELLRNICYALLDDKDWTMLVEDILYEIADIQDIKRWSSKKSVTESLLKNDMTVKNRIMDALDDSIRVGDKAHLYLCVEGMRQQVVKGVPVVLKSGNPKMIVNRMYKTIDKFDGNYDMVYYIERLFDTLEILSNVIDIGLIPRYNLKKMFPIFRDKYVKE